MHVTEDLYKHWCHALDRGRGGKKKVKRDTTLTKDTDGTGTLRFTFHEETLLTISPDNVVTFLFETGRFSNYTKYNRAWYITGISVSSDATNYRTYEQHVRIQVRSRGASGLNLPYTKGLQYQFGKCLNPEIAVDYKKTLNREKSLPLLRKTRPLASVLRVATRLDALERKGAWSERNQFGFGHINLDDPTAADAEIIFNLGNADKAHWLGSRWHSVSPEERMNILKRCAENGLVDYREWLYEKHGCYEYVQVNP